jgi:uncharacterized LabA/DUF88 family protein
VEVIVLKDYSEKRRSVLLVDGQNVFHSVRALKANFLYKEFVSDLEEEINFVKKIIFVAGPLENNNSHSFSHFVRKMRRLGFDVVIRKPKVFKPKKRALKCPYCLGEYEAFEQKIDGDMDIYIAVEAIKWALSGKVDEILILSGDLHFVPLLEFLKDLKKEVKIMGFVHSTSQELMAFEEFSPIPIKYLKDLREAKVGVTNFCIRKVEVI